MNGPLNTVGIASNTGLRSVERYEMVQAETRTNTVVLAPSTQLVCTIAATNLIVWQATLFLGGNAPGNVSVQWTTPATPASGGLLVVPGGGASAGYTLAAGYNSPLVLVPFAAGTDVLVATFEGWLLNGVNPGEFTLKWSQNVANATLSSLLLGSFMEVWRR
jgi:hypothetical protein